MTRPATNRTEKKTGSRTGIFVTFLDGGVEEGGGLDGTSIDASDFRVDVDGQAQNIESVVWNEESSLNVFITLADDLAGDDEPVVRLVGPVEDLAGRSTGTGQTEATDGIAPMLTVSVDGSADTVTNDGADDPRERGREVAEPLADEWHHGVCGREERRRRATTQIRMSSVTRPGSAPRRFRTVTSGEQWEWIFNLANATNGTYNVCIKVSDISRRRRQRPVWTKGTCKAAADPIDADKSITFTVDTVVNDPAVTPEKTDNAGAFIEIGYGEKITALTATIAGDAVDDGRRWTTRRSPSRLRLTATRSASTKSP